MMFLLFKTNIYYFVLSLFVQRKNQRKGAGNEKFSLFVRLLHKAVLAPPKKLNFAPFPVCLPYISEQPLCLFLVFWVSNGLR
jgi:hypothetical protein